MDGPYTRARRPCSRCLRAESSRDGPRPCSHRPACAPATHLRCARRARRSMCSLARSRTRASRHGCAPSACPCPCEVRAAGELHTGDLRFARHRVDEPSFVPAVSKCYAKSATCNIMFQVLQVLYIDVAKVDQDVANVVMVIHVCFKCIFQMFHLFHTNVASVLSGCCKSRFRCYIYMHVASIRFKCFQVFHMYVCKYFI
jgi:hypothetical protein